MYNVSIRSREPMSSADIATALEKLLNIVIQDDFNGTISWGNGLTTHITTSAARPDYPGVNQWVTRARKKGKVIDTRIRDKDGIAIPQLRVDWQYVGNKPMRLSTTWVGAGTVTTIDPPITTKIEDYGSHL